jgi:DNA-binding CsgD family transcriptional regulator
MARKSPKPAKSIQEIAEAERMSVSAVTMLLSRALLKLRREGLLHTCRELAVELDRSRATENSVRRPARGR